jgi:transposase
LAHTLLVVVYHMLSRRQPYHELGADYLDRLDPRRVSHRLVKRLERLGYKVTIEAQTAV